jgi:hypothetical protein
MPARARPGSNQPGVRVSSSSHSSAQPAHIPARSPAASSTASGCSQPTCSPLPWQRRCESDQGPRARRRLQRAVERVAIAVHVNERVGKTYPVSLSPDVALNASTAPVDGSTKPHAGVPGSVRNMMREAVIRTAGRCPGRKGS